MLTTIKCVLKNLNEQKKQYLKISLLYATTVFCDTFQISISVDVKSYSTKHDQNFCFKYRLTLFTWKSVLRCYAVSGYMTITIKAWALHRWQCVAQMARYSYFRKSVLIIYTRYKMEL